MTAPALPAGWVAANAQGVTPLWITSTSTPDSAPNAAFIDDPATVSDKRLDTPSFFVNSTGAAVIFRNSYALEPIAGGANFFDGAVLEVSSPNIAGGAFRDITDAAVGGSFVTGGYNGTISTGFMSPLAGRMAWSQSSGGYINTVANLGPNVNGQTIKLRFRMCSDSSVSGTGWRVDTLIVAGANCGDPTPTPSATPPPVTPTPTPTPTPSATCPPVITHSSSQTIVAGSVSCNQAGVGHADNSYWRAFNMATFTGSQQYNVTSVSFGIESANDGPAGAGQPVTVRLYTNAGGAFPGGTRTQIATSTVTVQDQTLTVLSVPLVATVPAGTSELVMEVFTPSGQTDGNFFFIGSNALPQTGSSYISATACGLPNPTDVSTIGFPNMHIVLNVHGSCVPGTPTPTPTPSATVGTPTPTPTPGTPTPTPTATPPVTPSPTATASATPPPSPTPTPTATATPTTQAINLSTRMRVQTGDNIGIGGFIITGSDLKRVLLRAIGPSLSGSGIANVLADPKMELHGPGAFVTITNNNWRETQEAEIIATGIAPTNDLESAIVVTLQPGAYTAIVKGNGDTSGVALVEIYDLNQAAASKLANLSTRAQVGTLDNIVIAGFMLSNNSTDDRVIVRGIGPSLASGTLPVSAVLADPALELRDENGALILGNDDWQDDAAQAAEITAAGLAPTNAHEAAIAAMLPPGEYTALLTGGTGIGVVEIYDLGP